MVKLYDLQANTLIGEISEDQLSFLAEQLEEESLEDQDYYLNRATLDMLEQAGGDAALIALLRQAMGDRDEMDILWEQE
jgi:processive 1,2-diacylglycerol beta-glucosyltransferase